MTTIHLPQGELRRIHASRPDSVLGKALAAIDGYTESRQRLAAFPAPVNAPGLDGVDSQPLVDDVVWQALNDGLPLDSSELRIAAANAHAEAIGFSLVANSVERLRGQVAEELDSAVRANVDRILTSLNGSLQDNLKAARDLLDRLGGVSDFDAAERAGLIAELRALRDREGEYKSVREAQHLVMAKVTGDIVAKSPIAHAEIPVAADAEFVLAALRVNVSASGATRPAHSGLPADDWTSSEAMAWCAKNAAARPWIPTAREFRDAQERQTAQLQSAREWLGPDYFHGRGRAFDLDKVPEFKRHLVSAHAALTA